MFRAFIELWGAVFAYAPVSEDEKHRKARVRALLLLVCLVSVATGAAVAL